MFSYLSAMPASKFSSHKPSLRKRESSGFSLIETALVLGVVGLVIGAIWVAASAVQQRHKLSKTLQDTAYIMDRTRHVFSQTRPDLNFYVGLDSSGAGMRASLFPADAIAATGYGLKNAWGLRYILNITVSPTGRYTILLIEVPSVGVCVSLVSALAGAYKRDSNFFDLMVSTGGDYAVDVSDIPATAVSACTDAFGEGTGDQVSVALTLKI